MQMKTQSRSHSYVGLTIQQEWKKASNPFYPLPPIDVLQYMYVHLYENKRGKIYERKK